MSINQTGLNEIAQFLINNHKTFSDRAPAISELCAWAADAEFQQREGNPPSIEIPAHHSVTGCPIEYTISEAGIAE